MAKKKAMGICSGGDCIRIASIVEIILKIVGTKYPFAQVLARHP